jgi:hypothetical protein
LGVDGFWGGGYLGSWKFDFGRNMKNTFNLTTKFEIFFIGKKY